MKLLKKIAVLTAAALCANGIIPAYAAEEVMTFRMSADTDTVYTDQLADGDVCIHGGVFIDRYTGLTSMRMILKSDEPLVIENGGFTVDPEKTDKDGEPMHRLFPEHADASYTQHSEFTGESNIVLWYAKNYTKDAVAAVSDPESSFVDFDIRIPQDTLPGDYKIYISDAVWRNEADLIEEDFFAYCGPDQLVLNENVILQSFTIHVLAPADTTEPVTTTTEPVTTTTEPVTTTTEPVTTTTEPVTTTTEPVTTTTEPVTTTTEPVTATTEPVTTTTEPVTTTTEPVTTMTEPVTTTTVKTTKPPKVTTTKVTTTKVTTTKVTTTKVTTTKVTTTKRPKVTTTKVTTTKVTTAKVTTTKQPKVTTTKVTTTKVTTTKVTTTKATTTKVTATTAEQAAATTASAVTTTTTTPLSTTTTAVQQPSDPYQDLSGDGKLDIADAVLLLRYVTEDEFRQTEKPVKLRLQAADLDHDGQLTLLDVMCMLSAIRRAGTDVP